MTFSGKRLAWWILVVVGSTVALPCATLQAQDDAESHIARGIALRRDGQNAAALAEFQAAYQAEPTARAKAQMALAQQALGDWLSAESNLLAALAADDDRWIQKHLDLLRVALETVRDHLASVRVETNVDGARLSLQDRPIGTAPLTEPIRVTAGTIRVEAQAEGHRSATTSVRVAGRSQATVHLDLAPLPAAEAPAPLPPPVAAAEPEPQPGAAAASPITPAVTRDSGRGIPTVSIVAFSFGGAALATAVVAHVLREVNANKWNDDAKCASSALQPCAGYRSTARTAETIAIVGYAAAGAAIVTGLVFWIASPSERADLGTARWGGNLGPGTAAISYSSRF